jgi:hypothetical protein
MSNQETQNQDKTTEEVGVDKKRRRFVAGASVAAPVILTLTSPSVFGAGVQEACYSQQMSGNASGTPASCTTGNSPQFWRDNPQVWPAPFTFGNDNVCPAPNSSSSDTSNSGQGSVSNSQALIQNAPISAPGKNAPISGPVKGNYADKRAQKLAAQDFTNIRGINSDVIVDKSAKKEVQAFDSESTADSAPTADSAAIPGTMFSDAIAFGPGNLNKEMSEILCLYLGGDKSYTSLAYFVAAILNAQTPGYILTVEQVRGLLNNPGSYPPPPGYGSVEQFLESTWSDNA